MAAVVKKPVSLIGGVLSSAAGAVGLGGKAAPAAAPTPVASAQPRSEADAIAAVELGKRGRASTLAGGQDEAAADQLQRGFLKKNQRQGAAARTLLG